MQDRPFDRRAERSSPTSRPIQVGALLPGRLVPAWVGKVLSDVESSDCADLALLIVLMLPSASRPSGRRAGHKLAALVDRRFLRPKVDAFSSVDGLERVPPPGIVYSTVRHGPNGWDLEPAAVEAIRSIGVDVLLDLTSQGLDQNLAGLSRWGTWALPQAGRVQSLTDGTGLVGSPLLLATLTVRSSPQEPARVVDKSVMAADTVSEARNLSRVAWESSSLVIRRLTDLVARGADAVSDASILNSKDTWRTSSPRHHVPQVGLLAARVGAHAIRRWRGAGTQWFVAYRPRVANRSVLTDTSGFRAILPQADRQYADPFPITHAGRSYLFFEDYRFAEGKAVISCAELRPDGPGPVRLALEAETHLSYPFVFESEGEVYMTPETLATGRVDLYRATRFPDRWELVRSLLSGIEVVDPSVVRWENRWWLFCGLVSEAGTSSERLGVFFADSLEGPWVPHPRNPVVADVRSSRPAGTPFVADGKLVRPAQDCSTRYGRAVVFNRVEAMDERSYVEVPFARLEPDWAPGLIATHTYSCDTAYEALDGMRRRGRR